VDEEPTAPPLLLVTVGSDHHPFDRLITWLDSWLGTDAGRRVNSVIQYGTARAPVHGEAVPFLPHADLVRLMAEATIIVAQGGPYSILESVEYGRIPIVVPRRRALGEVVDDHQFAFCALMAERGEAVVATTELELVAALDHAVSNPEAFLLSPRSGNANLEQTVERFSTLVGGLTPRPRRRLLLPTPPVRLRQPDVGQSESATPA
jgi:UDP-N-acetylglucosamine transferase subunit ALG13